MEQLTIPVTSEQKSRLDALAAKLERTTDQCLELAVQEFIDNWELHLSDLHQMDEHEARAVLNAPQE